MASATPAASPAAPVIVYVAQDGPTGLYVQWRAGGAMDDGAYFVARAALPHAVGWGISTGMPPTTGTRTFEIGTGPGLAEIWAQRNLDQSPSAQASLFRSRVTTTIPSSAVYGQPTVITGTVQAVLRYCDGVSCWPHPYDDANRLVLLQARQGTGAWSTVASTRSSAPSAFRFSVTAPGTRQYRVAVPSETSLGDGSKVVLKTGVVGPAVTTSTRFRVLGAKFLNPTVSAGQKATAYLKVSPPVDGRVMLQRRSGTTWSNVAWVPLTDGVAARTFVSPTRGQADYRYYVPTASYAGRPIAAAFTPTFVLTTR